MAKHYLTKLMAEKPLLPALVLALMVVVVISLVRSRGYLQLAELTVNDLLLSAAVSQHDEASPVVLVGVTEE